MTSSPCFNTASGTRCCNAKKTAELMEAFFMVSIPQAVRAVATLLRSMDPHDTIKFQYRKRYALLQRTVSYDHNTGAVVFQYRKRYALLQLSSKPLSVCIIATLVFQYRKRYALLQRGFINELNSAISKLFQYRKRYALLQLLDTFGRG